MSKIHLVWHKNPDTDSILSPLVYEHFLKSQWHDAEAIKIWPMNNESLFILEKLGFKKPRRVDTLPAGSKVFLLDHNTKKQAIDNLDELEVVWLVDHHNFGWFSTSKPIFARLETLGCTNSILYKMFKETDYEIPQDIAKLMISAIISDTLYFRSPTTTQEDIQIVEDLNQIAQIEDLEQRSLEMFNAKSDLGDMSANKLVKFDFKEFDVNSTRMAIGVLETTNPDYSLGRKEEILEAMQNIKQQEELDFILLCVIDILNETNTAFVLWQKEEKVIKDVFSAESKDNIADLWNRISRKKQIIPVLTDYFNKN